MRLEGPSAAIRQGFPEQLDVLMAIVTDFGGTEFLVVILALLFWLTRRKETATAVAYAVAGGALIIALKAFLDLPRPPAEVWVIEYDSDPHGFPSGHAFISTVVYGGLLYKFDQLENSLAAGGAVGIIALVSLSRVVLGLHYLGDVLVGAVLGVAFLAVMITTVGVNIRGGFVISVATAIAAVAIAGPEIADVWILLGFALGGVVAAPKVADLPALRSRLEAIVVTLAGLVVLITGILAAGVVTELEPAILSIGLSVGLFAGMLIAIMLIPAAIGRIEHPRLEAPAPGRN
ncbi:MAG: phosphatase PAP2 family protein [Natrialbaceae archaeon]|nr:phosphatase PAP2 family protein [Natrialbaceae archaeon]